MSQADEDTEKEHEPTQKKLDDARKKGDLPKSVDLMTASAYFGLLLTMMALGSSILADAGSVLVSVLGRADVLADDWFNGGGLPMSGGLILAVSGSLIWWFLVPAIAVLVSIVAQRAFVIAPSRIAPKLSRISLISNAKNKFGRSGLFEFFKSFLKLTIYSIILGYFLVWNLDAIVASVQFETAIVLSLLGELSVWFLTLVLIVAVSLGLLDLIFQRQEHQRKNRMSRKELTDENKQSEGDPHLKQQRRQRGYDIATNRMLEDVPEADVVIVNPTHYAVALKWSRAPGTAPKCVAKGVDEVAARIREIAIEAAIPIHRDPPTARAIHATTDIGAEIDSDQYQAVAVAIRFAESMREKARLKWS